MYNRIETTGGKNYGKPRENLSDEKWASKCLRKEDEEAADVIAGGKVFQSETEAGRKDFKRRTEEQEGKAKERGLRKE